MFLRDIYQGDNLILKVPNIVVIGSANMDLVVHVEHIPAAGETVLGGDCIAIPGGKGANQAVAAARLRGRVHFIGRVGDDAFGDRLRDCLASEGIDVAHLKTEPNVSSGTALIGVDAHGQNSIIVAPGANAKVSSEDIDNAGDLIRGSDIVVLQLEIPISTVKQALQTARSAGVRTILNPAPCSHTHPLESSLLELVDILTPNEHETASLLGLSSPDGLDMEMAAIRLREMGVGAVVITLGADGCLISDSNGERRIPGLRVEAVDTTAAGDCFTGALAVALSEGRKLDEAAIFANRGAAISVTRAGAQPSLPYRRELA